MTHKTHTQQTGGRPKSTKVHQAIALANDWLRTHQGLSAAQTTEKLRELFTYVADDAFVRRVIRNQRADALSRYIVGIWPDGSLVAIIPISKHQAKALLWWPGRREVIESEPFDFDQNVTNQGPGCTVRFTLTGDSADAIKRGLRPDKKRD